MSPLLSKIWFVRFIEVKLHLRAKVSVHFRQVSALKCPLYRGHLMKIWPENGRVQNFFHFSQVSALEHVHFRLVLLEKHIKHISLFLPCCSDLLSQKDWYQNTYMNILARTFYLDRKSLILEKAEMGSRVQNKDF